MTQLTWQTNPSPAARAILLVMAHIRPVLGEASGVLLTSGCRMGICHRCVVPLTEGTVRDLRDGALTSVEQGDPVAVQTCINAAAGPCRVEA